MSEPRITSIQGTIEYSDGAKVEFLLTSDTSSRWGAPNEVLGRDVDLFDEVQAEAFSFDDELECEGHESLDGAHMGETVYCNGSCRDHERNQ